MHPWNVTVWCFNPFQHDLSHIGMTDFWVIMEGSVQGSLIQAEAEFCQEPGTHGGMALPHCLCIM